MPANQWKVFADGVYGLTENPVWDKKLHGLWFLDIPQKKIHFQAFNQKLKHWQLDEEPGALWLSNGQVMVAAQHHIFRLNEVSNCFEKTAPIYDNGNNKRFNDCATSESGKVVIGSLVYDKSSPEAKVFSYEDNVLIPIIEGITTANGLGFSQDEASLYFADTAARKIGKIDCASLKSNEDKTKPKIIWHKPEQIARPDGLLVLGSQLWFAMFEGGELMCIDSQGEENARLSLPVWCPTKVCAQKLK